MVQYQRSTRQLKTGIHWFDCAANAIGNCKILQAKIRRICLIWAETATVSVFAQWHWYCCVRRCTLLINCEFTRDKTESAIFVQNWRSRLARPVRSVLLLLAVFMFEHLFHLFSLIYSQLIGILSCAADHRDREHRPTWWKSIGNYCFVYRVSSDWFSSINFYWRQICIGCQVGFSWWLTMPPLQLPSSTKLMHETVVYTMT